MGLVGECLFFMLQPADKLNKFTVEEFARPGFIVWNLGVWYLDPTTSQNSKLQSCLNQSCFALRLLVKKFPDLTFTSTYLCKISVRKVHQLPQLCICLILSTLNRHFWMEFLLFKRSSCVKFWYCIYQYFVFKALTMCTSKWSLKNINPLTK